jgi:hypothetical protein
MISSLCWVPKGAAKAVPEAAPISEEELANMRREAEAAAHDVLDDDASDSDRDSEWETDDSEDAEMDDAAAAVAKARAVAASMASTSGRERSTGQVGAAKVSGGPGTTYARVRSMRYAQQQTPSTQRSMRSPAGHVDGCTCLKGWAPHAGRCHCPSVSLLVHALLIPCTPCAPLPSAGAHRRH